MRRFACCLISLLLLTTACSTEVSGPEPQMDEGSEELATDPGFVCNEAHPDEGTWVTLSGEAFSALVVDAIATEEEPDVELPVVSLTRRLDPTGQEEIEDGMTVDLESPLGMEDGQVRWLDDETLQIKITDDLELEPGVYDITVENPDGQTATQHEAVGVLPPAELEAAIPELTCVAQGERDVTLEGEGILVGEESMPTVDIDDQTYDVEETDGCQGLHRVFGNHQLCTEAGITVDEASLEAGTWDVILENPAPADCPSHPEEDEVTLTIAPPPEVTDVQPTPICSEQVDYEAVEVSGQGFITLDDGAQLPEVTVGSQTYQPESTDECETIDEAPAMGAERCSKLTIHIQSGDLAGDVDDEQFVTDVGVQVQNPDPVGCHSTEDATVGVTPPPEITSVEPRATCNNGGTVTFDVTGDHLLEIDGETPVVRVDGQGYETNPETCSEVDGEEGVRGCTDLTVDVDMAEASLEGAYSMVAVNPEPANCESPESEEFYAAGPPEITGAEPDGFCQGASFDGELELFGQFVYDSEGDKPTVEVDGQEVSATMTGCDAALDESGLELCGGIQPDVSNTLLDDLEGEDFDVTVTGADPVACGSDSFTLQQTEPPTIEEIVPQRVCSSGSTFEVYGDNLIEDEEGAQAYLDDVPADDITVSTASGDAEQVAEVTFDDSLTAGTATFEYVNPGDCGTTHDEEQIRVTDGPLPVFVDPEVVFNDMSTNVTIYAAGLYGGTVDQVELVHPDGTTTDLGEPTFEVERPGVLQAEIPQGVLDDVAEGDRNAEGTAADFGVRLTDDNIECSNENEGLVTITEDSTLALDSIDPPFGGQGQSTGVDIFADTGGGTGFEATPRAYLDPVDDSVGETGREIQALQYIDEGELSGVVPEGLNPGKYNVIVVNPDGTVGVLDGDDAFEVTSNPPPVVDSVSPATWTNDNDNPVVTVEGRDFRDANGDPEVDVYCEDGAGGLVQPNAADVVGVETPNQIEVDVDAGNLDPLMACYLEVTNADGTYGDYSPITISNPSQKYLEFDAAARLNTARRAPTTLAGSPTRKSRFLYVLGGDDGDESGAYATGEFSRLNQFGEPVEWRDLPGEGANDDQIFTDGRTLAGGARIEDFLYLVGGSAEGTVTDKVVRARILDPLDVPEITTVDVDVEDFVDGGDTSGGLASGTYYYEVSAVYSGDDPANPGGESLTSEPQPIQLPIDNVDVTIEWEPPENINHDIDHYRIYRNVSAGDSYGGESLIATTDGTSYTDDGTDTPDDAEQPLPLGALGEWHEVEHPGGEGEGDPEDLVRLQNGRKELGVTMAPDPDTEGEYLIYAVGGDDGTDARADYEVIRVQADGPRRQTVHDATVGGEAMPSAQAQHQVVTATGRNAGSVADQPPQIFSIAGTGGKGVYSASVGTDGELGTWETASNISSASKYGHAGAAINDTLIILGGHNGSPSSNELHSSIQCGGGCPPATSGSWSSLSDTAMADRVLMGNLAYGGFMYLTGGLGTGDSPTDTVDYSVAGATP